MIENKEIDPISIIKVIATICVYCLHTSIFSSQWGNFTFSNRTWILQTPAWGAVWIFIFLSGFLNGGNFLGEKRKYEFTFKSFGQFYVRRFLKIILPTWFFVIIAVVLSEPEFFAEYPEVIWRILTLRYYNSPSCVSIGVIWYVCILGQLYLVTPLLCWIINKILCVVSDKKVYFIIILLIVISAFSGLGLRFYLYSRGVDWSSQVYVPFYCNLDIYISGILLSCIVKTKEYKKNTYHKSLITAIMIFIILIIVNSRCYYMGNTEARYILIYQYIFPTIYILIMSCVMYLISGWNVIYISHTVFGKMFACFADITFEFYLMHSMILYRVAPYLSTSTPNRFHIKLLLICFVMTTIMAIIFKYGYNGVVKKHR